MTKSAGMQETACFIVWAGLALLLVRGILPIAWLAQAYATGTFIILVNAGRTLTAHRFESHGEPMSFFEQIVDSTNVSSTLLASLLAPLGLRYHALHHLLPSMPYHSLPTAHKRLMHQLPKDSPYRLTVRDSFAATIRELWRAARRQQRRSVQATTTRKRS